MSVWVLLLLHVGFFSSFYTFGSIFGWCFSDRWRLNYAQIKCFLINFPVVWVKVVFFSHFFRLIFTRWLGFFWQHWKKRLAHISYIWPILYDAQQQVIRETFANSAARKITHQTKNRRIKKERTTISECLTKKQCVSKITWSRKCNANALIKQKHIVNEKFKKCFGKQNHLFDCCLLIFFWNTY